MVIKPDAVQAGKVEEIIERVKNEGMEVIATQEHTFTKEEAAEFYKQHEGSVSHIIDLSTSDSTYLRTTLRNWLSLCAGKQRIEAPAMFNKS